LQSYHTKNEVMKEFGTPDEKLKTEDIEVWTYNRDTLKAVPMVAKTDSTKNIYTRNFSDPLNVNQPVQHSKYIKFSFDTAGNVTGYKSNGINLGKTKKASFGKGMVNVLSVTAAIIVIAGVEIAYNGEFDF
jgi:hypothetical protein